jgi:hypothetical protein
MEMNFRIYFRKNVYGDNNFYPISPEAPRPDALTTKPEPLVHNLTPRNDHNRGVMWQHCA